MKSVDDCAIELLCFTKMNEFPQAGSKEFFELTGLLDALETALLQKGYRIQVKNSNDQISTAS